MTTGAIDMRPTLQKAISARDCREFHLITPRMTEQDCVDALAVLVSQYPSRRSQIRSIKARLLSIRMRPDMSRAAGIEMNKGVASDAGVGVQ